MPGAVIKVAVEADCAARGIVTSKLLPLTITVCSADSTRSAEVPTMPVLVVIVPRMEAGARAAVKRILPSAALDCTPVMTVAA